MMHLIHDHGVILSDLVPLFSFQWLDFRLNLLYHTKALSARFFNCVVLILGQSILGIKNPNCKKFKLHALKMNKLVSKYIVSDTMKIKAYLFQNGLTLLEAENILFNDGIPFLVGLDRIQITFHRLNSIDRIKRKEM